MSDKLCLQWNDFKDNIIDSFRNLRKENDYADVTLVCEDGKQMDSHKVVLSMHTCKKREIVEIYLRNFFWIFRKILG